MKIHVIYQNDDGSLIGITYNVADCYDCAMISDFITKNFSKDAVSCQWFSDLKKLVGKIDLKDQ